MYLNFIKTEVAAIAAPPGITQNYLHESDGELADKNSVRFSY
jgi:hypothetical protein